jgi:hypothetical protein
VIPRKVKRRGTVILTALFLSLIMFAMISATVLKIRYTQGMTRGQVEEARAIYLAKAGLHEALAMLNDGQPVAGVPQITLFGDDSFEFSRVDGPTPDLFYLVATGRTLNSEHTSRLVVRVESGDYEGAVFGRGRRGGSETIDNDKTDGLFVKKGSGNRWEPIEPPPRVRYFPDPSQPTGLTKTQDPVAYPENFQSLASTENGVLFGRYQRDGGDLDTLYQYDMRSDTWTDIPPPKTSSYTADGDPLSEGSDFAASLEDLAASENGVLYVRGETGGTLSGDAIYRYDTGSKKWLSPLPLPPAYTLDSSGAPTGTAGFATSIDHLEVDGDDNVYTVHRRGYGPSTILKFEQGSSAWKQVELPSKVTFRKGSFIPQEHSRPADHINQIAVSTNGDIFARGVNGNDAPDTLYRYTHNEWSVVPPPKQADLHKGVGKVVDHKPAKDYSAMSVDAEGRLYLVENRKSSERKYDCVYVWEEGEFSYLPSPSSQYYDAGSLRSDYGPDSSGGRMLNLEDIGGGSAPQTGSTRYVPTAEF